MSILVFIVVMICGMVAGASGMAMYNRQKNLEKRIADLEELSNKKHLPYKVAEAIEDAMAGLINYEFDLQITQERIQNVMSHLKNARNNRTSK